MYKLSMTMFSTKHIRDYSDLSRRYDTVPNDLKVYEYHYSELAKLISEANKEIEIEIDRKLEISELEAKVYAYEQIISNSNFKVMVEENKTKKKNKKRGKKK